jgi:membrane protein DedA with SNARE-associated domain
MQASYLIQLFLEYKYPLLIFLAFIEGPYVMMISGVLIKAGTFSAIPTYLALSFGDLAGDVAWYYIGQIFGNRFVRRFGMYFQVKEQDIERLRRVFHTNKKKILLGSKLTAGFGLSLGVLISAGMAEIPIEEFVILNTIGQIFWTAFMLAIGYFFGTWYITVNNVLSRIFIGGLAVLTLFLLLRLGRYIGEQMRGRVIK